MKNSALLARAVRLAVFTEVLGAATGLILLTPAPAQAQAQAPMSLEEVTVTARKRKESVLEVPISIAALGAEKLDKAGIQSLSDFSAFAPGLNFTQQVGNGPGGRSQGAIQFRGMSSGQGTNREQSGSIFIDGIFVSGGVASVDTSDVERVEILRGPQNAYFGRNTFGGAINFVTRNPGNEFKGQVSAGMANYAGYDFRGQVEGPLIADKLSGRISGVAYRKGAQYTARDGGKLGETQTGSVTGTLYATPSDNWFVRLRAHWQHDDDGAMNNAYVRGVQYGSMCSGQTFTGSDANGNPVSFALGRPYFCSSGSIPTPAVLVSQNTNMFPTVLKNIGRPNLWYDIVANNIIPLSNGTVVSNPLLARAPHMTDFGMKRDVVRVSAQTEYAFAHDITLAVNYGFDQDFQNTVYDPDRTDAENSYAALPALSHSWSGEVRLQSGQNQKLRWLIGYSYFEGQWETQQLGYQINSAFGAPVPAYGFVNNRVDDIARASGVFGSLEYDLLDNLSIGGEVRYQKDKQSSLDANLTTRTEFELTNTLPRVFVRYEAIPDLNLYATFGKGVTPGQLNGSWNSYTPPQQAAICATFDGCGAQVPQPKVDNYELGIKQRLLDGRLQYSLSIYKMDWKDMNTPVSVILVPPQVPSPTSLPYIAVNDATLKGIEFEGSYLLTDNWSVEANFNWQKNEYEKFYNSTLSTLTSGVLWFTGNEIPKQPDTTAVLSTTYRGTLSPAWSWYIRGDALYTGSLWDSEANIVEADSYTRVNARLGFDSEKFSVELYGRNLFDDDSWNYIARSTSLAEPGSLLLVPVQPGWFGYNPANPTAQSTVQGLMLNSPDKREYGVRVTYRF